MPFPLTATPNTIMPANSRDKRIPNIRLWPVDQISLVSTSTPKDLITDTITVAMIPAANPTL